MTKISADNRGGGHRYRDIVINHGISHIGDIHNIIQTTGLDSKEQHQQQILSSLRFPETNARRNDIVNSEFARYDWFLDNDSNEQKPTRDWPSIETWPRASHRAYVVQGKPGSGKSTFMKFVSLHRTTLSLLQQWAGSRSVTILFHSFWMVGTKLQYNMRGFLASLTYQIMDDRRIADDTHQTFPNKHHLSDWSEEELSADDEPDRIIDLIQKLSDLQNCKLCVSTRPIPYIIERWHDHFILKLHELNYNDISTHVVSLLEQKSHRITASQQKEVLIHDVATTICHKADGVFLWVHYVLKTVCRGIRVRDDLASLKKRIALLPSELSDLYRTMWEKQNLDNSILVEESAACFRLVQEYPAQLLFQAALRLDHDLFNKYTMDMTSIGRGRVERTLSHYEALLHTRSAGLIECRSHEQEGMTLVGYYYPFLVSAYSKSGDSLYFARPVAEVQFIHRSVSDFLTQTEFGKSLLTGGTQVGWLSNPSDRTFHECVCHLADIVERRNTYLDLNYDWMRGLTDIDERHVRIIDLIDSVYRDLITTTSSTPCKAGDWVLDFMQSGFAWHTFAYDYPGTIMQYRPSKIVVRYMLDSRGGSWSPYYNGYLVTQIALSRISQSGSGPMLDNFVQPLIDRGADLASVQVLLTHNIFYIRSPALHILCWLFVMLLSYPKVEELNKEMSRVQLTYWIELIHDQLECSTAFSIISHGFGTGLSCNITNFARTTAVFLVFDTLKTLDLLSTMLASMPNDKWTLENQKSLRARSKALMISVCVARHAPYIPDKTYRLDQIQLEKICETLREPDGSRQGPDELFSASATRDLCDLPDIVFGGVHGIDWVPTGRQRTHSPRTLGDVWTPCVGESRENKSWQERVLIPVDDVQQRGLEDVSRAVQRCLDPVRGPEGQQSPRPRESPLEFWHLGIHRKACMRGPSSIFLRDYPIHSIETVALEQVEDEID